MSDVMIDAALGPLTFRVDRWSGSITHENMPVGISLAGDRHGPEASVRFVAVGAMEHLGLLDNMERPTSACRDARVTLLAG
jgi:hypothetical protein